MVINGDIIKSRDQCNGTGSPPYRCEICRKEYIWMHQLIYHMRLHTRKRSYKFGVCIYRTKSGRRQNMEVHSENQPYRCVNCGERFDGKDALVKHSKTHIATAQKYLRSLTGNRKYTCKYCDKGFARRTDLNRHNEIHIGESEYASECEQSTTQLSYASLPCEII